MIDDSPDDAPFVSPERGGFFAKVRRGLFMTHTEILEKLAAFATTGATLDMLRDVHNG